MTVFRNRFFGQRRRVAASVVVSGFSRTDEFRFRCDEVLVQQLTPRRIPLYARLFFGLEGPRGSVAEAEWDMYLRDVVVP